MEVKSGEGIREESSNVLTQIQQEMRETATDLANTFPHVSILLRTWAVELEEVRNYVDSTEGV